MQEQLVSKSLCTYTCTILKLTYNYANSTDMNLLNLSDKLVTFDLSIKYDKIVPNFSHIHKVTVPGCNFMHLSTNLLQTFNREPKKVKETGQLGQLIFFCGGGRSIWTILGTKEWAQSKRDTKEKISRALHLCIDAMYNLPICSV